MHTAISLDGAQAIFTYMFKDPRWKMKLLIGTLIGFAGFIIPILPGFLLLGYGATIMRQIIIDHTGASLPEWSDWGTLFSRGLKMAGAMFLYMLPVVLLYIVGYALFILPIFAGAFAQNSYGSASPELLGVQLFSPFAGMALFLLGLLLSLPISMILPVAIAHGVANDSFTAAFHLRDWWKILRANFGGFFTAFVLISGVYFILIFALQIIYMTMILCILLPVLFNVVWAYMIMVTSAAVGEAYRAGAQNALPAAPLLEPVPQFDPA